MTEADLQTNIIELATLCGWRVFHPRTVRTAEGRHLTAFQGHAGFPDLVLAGADGVLFVELKSDKGRPTEDQQRWLAALEAGGAETYLWRPSDWPQIVERLRGDR